MAARKRYSGRPQDAFGARAKKEGFAARAVYKLQEIDKRTQILRRGMRVLDLGAYPGSWSQYASTQVGPQGRITALDIQPLRTGLPPNVHYEERDVLAVTPAELGGPGSFDVVLSDMAPNTSGNRFVDQCRSHDLFMHALSLAEGTLSAGGNFCGKLFQGPDFQEARAAMQKAFSKHRIVKPEASRKESIEVFVVGLGLRD